MKLKKGDTVIVLTGKDKGKKGKIERVNMSKKTIIVPNINVYKRHVKRRDEKNPGGILDVPRSLDSSKVALICPKCKQQTRIGYQITKQNQKKRICKKCKQTL
jgi:large subunit ribosomal protein L24